jgi:hypothetical protein
MARTPNHFSNLLVVWKRRSRKPLAAFKSPVIVPLASSPPRHNISKVSFFFCLTLVLASFIVGVLLGPALLTPGLSFNQSVQESLAPVTAVTSTTIRTPLTNKNSTASWCPKAVCLNSDLCRPCQERRFLILLATARSASTTLDFMLDSLPGVRMSGENNDELKAIRDMMENVMLSVPFRYNNKNSVVGPWGHNPIPPGEPQRVSVKK